MGQLPTGMESFDFSSEFTDDIRLPSREAHIIRANLPTSSRASAQLFCLLSPDERERAARYRLEEHRRRFIVGRALLRTILATYLRISPAEVRFTYGPQGKPNLDKSRYWPSIDFNASVSEELAVFAIAPDVPVGVDVERVSPRGGIDSVARRICSPAEYRAYAALAGEEKTEAFFRCWSRKEALAKAIGGGLAFPMNQCDVSTGGRVFCNFHGGDAAKEAEWFIHDLSPAEGFVGALATRPDGHRILSFSYPETD